MANGFTSGFRIGWRSRAEGLGFGVQVEGISKPWRLLGFRV